MHLDRRAKSGSFQPGASRAAPLAPAPKCTRGFGYRGGTRISRPGSSPSQPTGGPHPDRPSGRSPSIVRAVPLVMACAIQGAIALHNWPEFTAASTASATACCVPLRALPVGREPIQGAIAP